MTYVGWDGREYEDLERDNMREAGPDSPEARASFHAERDAAGANLTHPCSADCIDPVHDGDYARISDAVDDKALRTWAIVTGRPILGLGHDRLFPDCEKPLPHQHSVRFSSATE